MCGHSCTTLSSIKNILGIGLMIRYLRSAAQLDSAATVAASLNMYLALHDARLGRKTKY